MTEMYNVQHSDAYGIQKHYSDSGQHDKDEEKNERWRKMTKLSANYACSAR